MFNMMKHLLLVVKRIIRKLFKLKTPTNENRLTVIVWDLDKDMEIERFYLEPYNNQSVVKQIEGYEFSSIEPLHGDVTITKDTIKVNGEGAIRVGYKKVVKKIKLIVDYNKNEGEVYID